MDEQSESCSKTRATRTLPASQNSQSDGAQPGGASKQSGRHTCCRLLAAVARRLNYLAEPSGVLGRKQVTEVVNWPVVVRKYLENVVVVVEREEEPAGEETNVGVRTQLVNVSLLIPTF